MGSVDHVEGIKIEVNILVHFVGFLHYNCESRCGEDAEEASLKMVFDIKAINTPLASATMALTVGIDGRRLEEEVIRTNVNNYRPYHQH